RPLFSCEDSSVLGVPFYVMERRRGVILRRADSPGRTIDPTTARRLSTALIDNLALLHALDYQVAGLADVGKPEGYVTRPATGFINRYANARTDALPEMDRIAQWLSDHMPAGSGARLGHTHYKDANPIPHPADLT